MVDPVTVAGFVGTYLLLALFLAVTAHVAARNVLGEVRFDRALLVGPATAAVSVLQQWVFPLVVVAVAVAVDALVIRHAYELETRLAAYVTLIHVVVSIILAVLLGALLGIVFGFAGGA